MGKCSAVPIRFEKENYSYSRRKRTVADAEYLVSSYLAELDWFGNLQRLVSSPNRLRCSSYALAVTVDRHWTGYREEDECFVGEMMKSYSSFDKGATVALSRCVICN